MSEIYDEVQWERTADNQFVVVKRCQGKMVNAYRTSDMQLQSLLEGQSHPLPADYTSFGFEQASNGQYAVTQFFGVKLVRVVMVDELPKGVRRGTGVPPNAPRTPGCEKLLELDRMIAGWKSPPASPESPAATPQ